MRKLAYIYIFLLLTSLAACDSRKMTTQLDLISQKAETNPDSALILLSNFDQAKNHWSKGDRMYYELVKLKAENKNFAVFTTDTIINEVVDYFQDHGTANERMLAYYLQGRVYSDMGEAPQALQAYYDAIECADTTSRDCDYNTLIPVYGQMSQLFHQQNLPHDEIWALNHYIDYIRRYDSEKEYAISKCQLIRPYYLLDKKDTVLQIINETYNTLKKMGEDKEAACTLITSIHIYIEKGQIDKAHQTIETFEKESGLIDKYGNIERGREHYYDTKGLYELAINNLDSAEYYFRKVIRYGYHYDGYRGLLSVFRKRNIPDSIAHYSLLFESALDSLHKNMEMEAIHKMSSHYNYSRIQKIAEQESQKVLEAKFWGGVCLAIIVLTIVMSFQLYMSYKKRKLTEIKTLSANLTLAQKEYQSIQEELLRLKKRNYDLLIVEKEKRRQELKQYIAEHTSTQELPPIADNLSEFEDSGIANILRNKKDFSLSKKMPNKAEWRMLEVQFSKDMPAAYKVLTKEKKLSPLELRVCILLILDFEDSSIVYLTDSISQTISNTKSRANKKIFKEKGAQTLRANLLRMITHP